MGRRAKRVPKLASFCKPMTSQSGSKLKPKKQLKSLLKTTERVNGRGSDTPNLFMESMYQALGLDDQLFGLDSTLNHFWYWLTFGLDSVLTQLAHIRVFFITLALTQFWHVCFWSIQHGHFLRSLRSANLVGFSSLVHRFLGLPVRFQVTLPEASVELQYLHSNFNVTRNNDYTSTLYTVLRQFL